MNFEYGQTYNAVDIAAAAYLLIGLGLGLRRKLSGELARLIGAVLAFLVAWHLHVPLTGLLTARTRLGAEPSLASALAFTLLLVAAAVCVFVLRRLMQLLMKVTFNEKIDTVAGGAAGLLRAAVVCFIVILAAGMWPCEFLRRHVTEQSMFGRAAARAAPAIVWKARELLNMPPAPVGEHAPSAAGKQESEPARQE